MTETCINHPNNPAIEHCEICAQPLCGYCLWYADDGRRLCERHAQALKTEGKEVYPPSEYSEGISDSHLELSRRTRHESKVSWQGNNQDLMALIAAVIAITGVASLMGFYYCIPCVSGVLAIIALSSASSAFDEKRTRTLAMISLAGAVIPVVIIAMFCIVYLAFAILVTSTIP